MTAASEIVTAVGFRICQVIALDSSNYPAENSSTKTSEAAGLLVQGVQALTINKPGPQILHAQGDDRVFTSFHLPATEGPTAELRTGKFNMTLDALLTGLTVKTVGESQFLPQSTDQEGEEIAVMLLAQSYAHDTDDDSSAYDADHYYSVLIPKAKLVPRGGSQEAGNIQNRTYDVVIEAVTEYPWGEALTSGTDGCTRMGYVEGTSENKLRIVRFTGDGTTDAFAFTVNAASTDKITVYQNGTAVTTNITKEVTGITFAAEHEPADEDVIVVVYERAS